MNYHTPLAERMRPKTLRDYIGQKHLVGEGAILHKAIDSGILPSMILWGPPGVGKTTLAQIIAQTLDRPFYALSAINSGVKDIREVIDKVKNQGLFGGNNAILFIDEIHRFSKSQQDSLLGAVERGIITLIGATTENPSFEVISALLSRCQVYVLKHLEKTDLEQLLNDALMKDQVLKKENVQLAETNALLQLSGGDARKLLNALELVVHHIEGNPKTITNSVVMESVQENMAFYDKGGEQHYDVISAFIKSIRGSDPNAASYWLARMIESGEDPKFIARRMIILASEDIGNANPTALVMATTCFDAVAKTGMPEGRIVLAQCATYLACSPKSNASYMAINLAQKHVKETGSLPVPLHIRNAPTKLMKELGYGKNYRYSHNHANNFATQEYLPEAIKDSKYYEPGKNKREEEMRRFLKIRWGDKYDY